MSGRRAAVLAIASAGVLLAASGRGVAPAPPPAQIADTLTASYEINGLRILHRRTTATNVIAVNLYLLGGARQVTAANAGVEPFLLLASEYGTERYPGEAARRAMARSGSSITVMPGIDWMTFAFHGLKEDFDSTWAVFADRLMHPSLDSTGMAIVRAQLLSNVHRRLTSPDAHVATLAESLAYEGHPYAIDPTGTEQSIRTLTADDLRRYAGEQFVTSRMLLVVVGDVPREQLDQAVTRTIGTLPRGSYSWTLPAPWKPEQARIAAAQRAIPTNYVFGYFSGPQQSSPDYPAFERAMGFVSSWVTSIVREEYGLSYAAGVPVFKQGATGAGIYMSTTRPDTAIKLVNRIVEVLATDADVRIPRPVLRKAAESFRTEYLFGMESSASHADMLARAQLYNGDYRAASQRAEAMGKVGFSDMRRAIKTYMRNIQYGYVGDTTKLPRAAMLDR